jgi:leader peptidase (prepilin peptidase)/N-methyltransferase
LTEPLINFLPFLGLAFLGGAIIGSFLNVVIHRVPRGESIVRPGSHCPACGHAIRPVDNIPLLGFILRQGRCRDCGGAISVRYPLVELLTATLFAGILWRNGPTPEALPQVVIEMGFAAALVALIFIDAATRTLPNVITYPLFLGVLLATLWRGGWGEPISYNFDLTVLFTTGVTEPDPRWMAIRGGLLIALAAPGFWLLDRLDLLLFGKYLEWEELGEEPGEEEQLAAATRRYERTIAGTMIVGLLAGAGWIWLAGQLALSDPLALGGADQGLLSALIGATVAGLPLWLLRTVHFLLRGMEGMGLGDIKLMAGIGAFLGWQGALSVLLLGSIAGVIGGLLLMRRSGERLQTAIPFGCFLGLAALLVLFRNTV